MLRFGVGGGGSGGDDDVEIVGRIAEKKVPSIKFLKKHEPPSPAGLQVAPTATIHVINGQVPSTQ